MFLSPGKTHTPLRLLSLAICSLILSLGSSQLYAGTSDFWRNATVYFMLTDRFNNGDPSNDASYARSANAAFLRGFEGGDIRGITQKIEDGYFNALGVDAIWMTPVVEQVHGFDDSSGITYSYHGYWPKDWTSVDANFGNEEQLAEMIEAAHHRGIRVIIDVIINHTGPQTAIDEAWPEDWIRTRPLCNWSNYQQNTRCALATSLTDIRTESEQDTALPAFLLDKWQKENRLQQELAELDAFFNRTGYPRAPKYYIVKWLTDWVREYGVDGFRVDTAKHVEPEIWATLKHESELAFAEWKKAHPQQVLDDESFYMVGEVFNWGVLGFANAVSSTLAYDYGDKQVNFFDYGFDALINMGFVEHIKQDSETLYQQYSDYLNQHPMAGKGILSYIGSHDDQNSFDRKRTQPFSTAFKLMMAPGGVQIYYGDELARPMLVEGTFGDAGMRAMMNWDDLSQAATRALLVHWQKLGTFRQRFPAVGAGLHKKLRSDPYIFQRTLVGHASVIIASELPEGKKSVTVSGNYADGSTLYDYYSHQALTVSGGQVHIDSPFTYALIGPQ